MSLNPVSSEESPKKHSEKSKKADPLKPTMTGVLLLQSLLRLHPLYNALVLNRCACSGDSTSSKSDCAPVASNRCHLKVCLLLQYCYDFPLFTLMIPCVTHAPDSRTDDSIMLTFTPRLLDDRRLSGTPYLLSSDAALCTCTHLCRLCLATPHVYKRSTSRLRNSKRVLFCTNTSRRRTCIFLIL